MKCPRCNSEMKNVMHFERGKSYAFHSCKRCNTDTHKKRIHFDEIDKKEDKTN